jgi:NAD(P)H dehydrogenase (quinone)
VAVEPASILMPTPRTETLNIETNHESPSRLPHHLLGSPTRYGNMTAAMKALIDSTVSLWLSGAMEGKPAGVFTSTASTHGGQETTCVTMMIPLIHLGMLIVGVPYSTEGMIHTEGRGGTPYGATTISGPKGELAPTAEELAICRVQGKRVAELAKKIRG